MRKNLFLLALGIAAVPAFAGMAPDFKKENNPFYNGASPSITVDGKTYQVNAKAPAVAPTRAGNYDIITDPVGEEQLYTKDCAGTFVFFGQMELYMETFPAYIVWGNNDYVYLKDPLSTFVTDSYIVGKQNGDLITFETGQVLEYDEDEGYGYAIGVFKAIFNQDTIDFELDSTVQEFSLKANGDGGFSLVLPGEPFNGEDVPDYTLGYYFTDDMLFTGFSDFYQEYAPQQYQLITMPAGVEPEQYVIIDEFDYASFVQVAYTDEYIYIKGLDPMVPEGVVRARIEGNKAYISQNQYVGLYLGAYFIFTKIWVDNPDYTGNYKDDPYILTPASTEFELEFDREAGIITATTPGIYLSFQPDEDTYVNSNCFLSEFILKYQKDALGTPANPTRLNYLYKENLVQYYGYADFQFSISNYSTEGNILDENFILYRIFVNGEPVIFKNEIVTGITGYPVEAYPDVPGEQYWLPYLFNNYEDISKWSSNEFDIGIYVADVKTLSVQSCYVYPDAAPTYSDIVTLNVETGDVTTTPAAVKTVSASPVKSVEYYSLSGLKVSEPKNGIYIQRNIHSDGTVTTQKIVVK